VQGERLHGLPPDFLQVDLSFQDCTFRLSLMWCRDSSHLFKTNYANQATFGESSNPPKTGLRQLTQRMKFLKVLKYLKQIKKRIQGL